MRVVAKFSFKLQSFLNVKHKLEELKKQEYGRALTALEAEKQKKALLVMEKNSQVQALRNQVYNEQDSVTIRPNAVLGIHGYINILKQKIILQDVEIQKAQAVAEQKRMALIQSMNERKMLEKVKEREHETFNKEQQRNEQRLTDEIVSYRYSEGNGGS